MEESAYFKSKAVGSGLKVNSADRIDSGSWFVSKINSDLKGHHLARSAAEAFFKMT